VRTRFSAFALGEVEYLWRTLDARHELRSQERDAVLRSLRTSSRSARYRSLEIHESKIDGDRASVLFTARIFVQGRDRSFVELAFFARSGGAWRYLDGITLPPDRIAEKTIARFEALIEARG
jgi:SEC-C motif domain protein